MKAIGFGIITFLISEGILFMLAAHVLVKVEESGFIKNKKQDKEATQNMSGLVLFVGFMIALAVTFILL